MSDKDTKPTEKVDELSKLTIKDLRAKAIELGLPAEDAESFDKKAPLIATINVLKAKEARVETLNPKVKPKTAKADERKWRSKAERMRDKLMKQPLVKMLLPLDPGEKPGVIGKKMVRGREETYIISGAYETVQLNGYKIVIPKGVYFDVPEQVSKVLSESYRQTQDAGREFLADREDKKGGKVSDKLSG